MGVLQVICWLDEARILGGGRVWQIPSACGVGGETGYTVPLIVTTWGFYFQFLRNLHTVLHSGCTSLQSTSILFTILLITLGQTLCNLACLFHLFLILNHGGKAGVELTLIEYLKFSGPLPYVLYVPLGSCCYILVMLAQGFEPSLGSKRLRNQPKVTKIVFM